MERFRAFLDFRTVIGTVSAAGLLLTAALWAVPAQEHWRRGDFEGRPALVIANDVIELTVLETGGALASVVLKDDPDQVNPMWNRYRADREEGRPPRAGGGTGHFVCVDGFGPASEEESAAGLPGHGEAHTVPWTTTSSQRTGNRITLEQSAYLPRVQEVLTRKLTLIDGENLVYARSSLESLLAFDRPACWAEHGTIGSPFLEAGVTVVDMSANRAMTRPHQSPPYRLPHRLASGQEFNWPLAPTLEGRLVDLRAAPQPHHYLDHTGHLMDPEQPHAWVTALHTGKRLLLGYVFKPADFPWLQTWEFYPREGVMARGLEFGTQAFDLPRRKVITDNRLFGQFLYRWLPALSKIETSFLMFWARAPEGMQGVSEIQLKEGRIVITDHRSGKTLELKASQPID